MIEDIRKTLWAAADKLRANMDAAEYKHIVLGLIFVKYISDTFQARREELIRRFADPADDYFLHDCDDALLASELEDRDYYKEVNVFWVPEDARWEKLRNAAKQADIGKRIDDALALIETENPRLKGILDKRYARAQLPQGKLGELVDLVSQIGFGADVSVARDILGQVYEYFLGQFASAEGKKGGQFYTPASIVQTLVAVLAPHHGQVYDPCCGSGGMFVQSEKFIESHGGKLGDVSIYGQESNPTTWRLAAMNLAIRGIDFNLGKEPNDTFTRNQHPDLRADFVLANPPFNISDWWHGSLEGDPRWVYGTPPAGNANYAWLQHMLYHLKPGGRAGIVLANGSMSSSQNSEGDIRRAMVEADVVECMVALPGQLFFNTQIPACLWFLRKPPSPSGRGARLPARVKCSSSTPASSAPPSAACRSSWILRPSPASPTPSTPGAMVIPFALSLSKGRTARRLTPTSPASAAACRWPRSPNTAMCSPPAATSARKRSRTTTKPSPTRCWPSPKSSASRWPRVPNSTN